MASYAFKYFPKPLEQQRTYSVFGDAKVALGEEVATSGPIDVPDGNRVKRKSFLAPDTGSPEVPKKKSKPVKLVVHDVPTPDVSKISAPSKFSEVMNRLLRESRVRLSALRDDQFGADFSFLLRGNRLDKRRKETR
jgi:hypothetical protein